MAPHNSLTTFSFFGITAKKKCDGGTDTPTFYLNIEIHSYINYLQLSGLSDPLPDPPFWAPGIHSEKFPV